MRKEEAFREEERGGLYEGEEPHLAPKAYAQSPGILNSSGRIFSGAEGEKAGFRVLNEIEGYDVWFGKMKEWKDGGLFT